MSDIQKQRQTRYSQWPAKGLHRLIGGAEWTGVVGIVFITLALVADVLARSALNKPLPAIKELVELLLPLSWALLLASTQAAGGHVRVVFLIDRMGPKLRASTEMFMLVLSLILFAALTWQTGLVAWESFLRREYIMAGVEYPVYPTRIAVFFGCLLICLQHLYKIVLSARDIAQPT
jgi:TRAP-type C4-dicarboxylate transport system permease small subunit